MSRRRTGARGTVTNMEADDHVTPEDVILNYLARAEMGLWDADLGVNEGPVYRLSNTLGQGVGVEYARLIDEENLSGFDLTAETLRFAATDYATFVAQLGVVAAQLLDQVVTLSGRTRENILADLRRERGEDETREP